MRIVIDVSPVMDRPLTGVGWRTVCLIKALLERNDGFDIRLFAARSRNTPRTEFPFSSGFSRSVILPYFRRLKSLLWPTVEWPPIEWFCGKTDLAHGTFHDVPPSRRAIRLVTIHDLSFCLYPETHTPATLRVQTRLLDHAVRRADAFEAVSESCRTDLIRVLNVPAGKIHVVPGGVWLEEFEDPMDESALAAQRRRLGLTREYLIHLGTIEPRKNLPRLIEAYGRIRERFREYPQLLLVGAPGWMAAPTLDAIQVHGAGDDIILAGYAPREQAVLLLRGAAACVYPSVYEGFGLPVLEAMAARVPVIASNAAALREVAQDCCIYVDPSSVESIEAGLDEFLTCRDAAQQRTGRAYARAQTLTWRHSAEKLANLYKDLAAQRGIVPE